MKWAVHTFGTLSFEMEKATRRDFLRTNADVDVRAALTLSDFSQVFELHQILSKTLSDYTSEGRISTKMSALAARSALFSN